jgi:AsmA protein
MKIFKYLMLAIGTLILLVVITVGVFLATFDANQYKQELSGLVLEQTGRELTFRGDIGLTLYPALGMKLGSLTLSNAAGFGNQPMLSVNKVSASVDVLSILSLKPQVAQLVLDGLSVDLQKNAQGMTNWDDLVKKAETQPESTTPAPATDKSAEGKPVEIAGVFGGLNITHANINWKDAQAGAQYSVKDLSLISGSVEPEKAFPLSLKLSLSSAQQLSSDIQLDTEVLFKNQTLKLSAVKLNARANGKLIPLDEVKLLLNADVEFALNSNQLSVKGLNTQINTTGGALASSEVKLAGEVGFDLNQQHLTIAVLDVTADVAGESVPNQKMKVAISSSQLDMKLDKRSIDLQNLVMMLNENRFEGFVKVEDYAKPALSFKLDSKSFDVDKLTGWVRPEPVETPTAVDAPATEPAPDVEIALPMELLRSLKIDGELGIGKLIAQGLSMQNLLLKVKAADGVIELNPIKLDLYDGSFDGSVKINAQGEKPVYSVNKKLSAFHIGEFLKDFMQKDPVSGLANLDVNITTQGDWLSQLKSNLNGKVAVAIEDGALNGFNLRAEIDKAKASLQGEKLKDREVQKTDFSALSLGGVINNGVFATDDLILQAPLLRVGGAGTVNLVKESVDYLVNAKIVGTTKGQGAGGLNDLAGLLIPVKVTGSWLDPELDVQLDDILKKKFDAEKARIAAEVANQKAALQAKLAAEKANLKAAQEKKIAAEKEALAKKKALLEAEQKAKLEAEKQKQQAALDAEKKKQQDALDAKKKAEQERAKKKLEDKLKKLF